MRGNNIMQDLQKKKPTPKTYIEITWKLLKASTESKAATSSEFFGVLGNLCNQVPNGLDTENDYYRAILHIHNTAQWHNRWNALMTTEKPCNVQHFQKQPISSVFILESNIMSFLDQS